MSWYEPVLGTVLQTVVAPAADQERLERVCLAEIARLDEIFSRYRDDSELAAYNAGALLPTGELAFVLAEAEGWRLRSERAFDHGAPPHVDLDAIAKGFIVDRALAAVMAAGATSAVVDIGGDLAHAGTEPVSVGIEDPRTPYDNAPPLQTVRFQAMALATSGTARRGEHIRDPRSGGASTRTLSVSVLAATAMTADALATVTGVMGLDEAAAILAESGGEALVVTAEGVRTSPGWSRYVSAS